MTGAPIKSQPATSLFVHVLIGYAAFYTAAYLKRVINGGQANRINRRKKK
jgi:hypothetical protein